MSDSNPFERIFSAFTPLSPHRRHEGGESAKKKVFKISVSEGEPFIGILPATTRSDIRPRDTRLYEEIIKASQEEDLFNPLAETSPSLVSLWENPYLIHLARGSECILSPESTAVTFSEEPGYLILDVSIDESSDEARISLKLHAEGAEYTDPVFLDDANVICADRIFPVESVGMNYRGISRLIKPVDKQLLDSYLTLFVTYVGNVSIMVNGNEPRYAKTPEHTLPTLYLEKVAADKALYLRTGESLESLGDSMPPGFRPTMVAHVEGERATIRTVEGCDIDGRTSRLHSMILDSAPDRAAKKDVYREGDFFIIPEETAGPFLLKCLPFVLEEFRLVGSEKLKEYKVVACKPRLNLKFSSGIDFLDGEGDVTIGNEKFTIADILSQFAKKRYIRLSDGNRGIIDEKYINRLQRLFRHRDKEGHFRVTLFDLPEVENLIQEKIKGKFADSLRSVLEGFNTLKKKRTPSYKVNASLRPYQKEGVKWLRYLYDHKLGGCLADDMGLGKTLQTISLLSMIYPGSDNPTLVVMPRSLLFNWEKELDRFAPQISHATYYGPDRNLDEALKADIVLTTYAIARNDVMQLKEHRFECIVLDESQNIKNFSAQTTMAVQLLQSDHRLALSGTPMENNLTELYSLFCFLNPTMFGSIDDFNALYTHPIQKFGDKDASDSLRRKIFPFILRRLKRDVLDDLPERIDQTIYVEMSDKQKHLYNERRLSFKEQIGETIARDGVQKAQFMMLQALSELRRIASVPESMSDGRISSPKIDELVDSLVSSVSNGHKTVVFFNFIAGIEIMMQKLEKLGIEFETMTGSTSASARKRIVERFQSDPSCMVMLLTLKVGGVGLNLTAADTVYVFEPWWNKAVEEQAINRLHRIGQKSTVNSFSMITVGTIEEKILQLQNQKSELFNELISADTASSKHLSEKDIEFILS